MPGEAILSAENSKKNLWAVRAPPRTPLGAHRLRSPGPVIFCGLRPSVLGQDRSETKKIGLSLGLAGLVLRCETWSCHARRHNDLEEHSNFSSTICSFSIMCLEHHYCGDLQWRSQFTYLKEREREKRDFSVDRLQLTHNDK